MEASVNNTMGKIYNEDCLDTLKRMEDCSIDLILTSPPYNKSKPISEYALKNHQCHYKEFDDNRSNEEYLQWILERFNEFERVLKNDGAILFNMSYSTESSDRSELMWLVVADVIRNTGLTIADRIIWHKSTAIPNNVSHNKLTRICEDVFIFCKRDRFHDFHCNKKLISESITGMNIYENIQNIIYAANNDGNCEIHKATVSTHFCFQLLELYGIKKGCVYDPFMGTGTTAIAAIEYGMDYIGSEISKEYCEYAEKRIKDKESQLSLFF